MHKYLATSQACPKFLSWPASQDNQSIVRSPIHNQLFYLKTDKQYLRYCWFSLHGIPWGPKNWRKCFITWLGWHIKETQCTYSRGLHVIHFVGHMSGFPFNDGSVYATCKLWPMPNVPQQSSTHRPKQIIVHQRWTQAMHVHQGIKISIIIMIKGQFF